eukprot:CAMPEP_0172606448 /NCGR_PEP_ID=MMETSP1068-20121228/26639_1 /TAXON_ID=35684 /ORGANISM="Pseudopedinella elastica, Strain CCMP716" /LENGTH=654 /DNA_ID=CAMNT_0013409143 /DNA_START=86 /DNA_END=2050 /DNA_ORIENTATION=-
MTHQMNVMRVFAFLAVAPSVWSVGQCDANGQCTVKGGIKDGDWWRKELNSAQPECKDIDPQNTGTCHQWTVKLDPGAVERVREIKQTLNDYIMTTEQVALKSRVLSWNDPMDELYLSAPKNVQGSDRVFVTPHIDGFVGWIPFMRAWRCVYGLTGPHDTVTIQPMRNPDEREVTLGPGVFTCFDYNREIHWIENRPNNATGAHADERMVLKIHFYEYPAVLGSFLGNAFGALNANYNFLARRAFLVSQFPDRSVVSRLVARAINGITLFGGSFEVVYGYCNMGIVAAAALAVKFNLHDLIFWAGSLHLVVCLLAVVFRSTPLGVVIRDAVALNATSLVLLATGYLKAQASKFDLGSHVVTAVGFGLAGSAYASLGADLTYFGAQLAPGTLAGSTVSSSFFPYSAVSHPMTLGSVVGLLGLRLHPVFGPKFHSAFLAQSLLHVALLAAEVFDVHLPAGADYFSMYADFAQYHQSAANVYAHLLTTGVSLVGVFGLLNLALAGSSPASGKASSAAGSKGGKEAAPSANLPLLALSLSWIGVRYTVPDDDVAHGTVALAAVLATLAWAFKPTKKQSLGLVVGGALGQEIAHALAGEGTYMAAYASEALSAGAAAAVPKPGALVTFLLHNVWLVPFEIRAAVNTLAAQLTPSMAPGTV